MKNCARFFLCIVTNVLLGAVSLGAVTVDYTAHGEQALRAHVPKKFFLERLIIDADIPVNSDEFYYLTGLKEKAVVHEHDLNVACFYLKQSRCWRTIVLQLNHEQHGVVLTFILRAQELIQSIDITGIWFGKDSVKQRYLLSVGEVFDQQKHDESLKRIEKFFKNVGYWQVAVEARVIQDEKTKRVRITIDVHKGPRFVIKHVQVQITGDQHVLKNSEKKFLKQAQTLTGKTYTKHAVKRFMRFLRTELVRAQVPGAPIQISQKIVGRSGLAIAFTVDVSSKHRVILTGNKQVSSQKLLEYMLDDQQLFEYMSVPFLMNHIKHYYQERGFVMADVTAQHNNSGWHVQVREGPCVHVQEVTFKGISAVRVNVLSVLCKPLISRDIIDESGVQKIEDAIMAYYEQHGFWNARIVEREFIQLSTGIYRLEFTLDEGVQRILKKITITTDMPELLKYLYACVPIVDKPEPFDWCVLDRCKQELERCVCVHHGYAHVSYELVSESDGTIVRWLVKHEPLLVYGKTIFTGSVLTNHDRLMRLLAYCTGDSVDSGQLNETFNRFNDLGIFESIRISPVAERDPDNKCPMMINLDAGTPFEAQARLGLVGTNNLDLSTYTLGFSLIGKNITSHLDTLMINVELTRFCRDCALLYRYPRVAGLPFTAHVRLFDKKTDMFCSQASQCVLYTALQRGLAVQSDYYSDLIKAALSIGVEGINIAHLFEPCARELLFDPTMRNHYEPYAAFEPVCDVIHVDDVLNPRVGFTTHVGARIMLAQHASKASFARFLFEQAFFVPFSARVVGALRLRAGYIFCPSFACLLPSERFYLGGPCSIRAYQQDYMPPLACCGERDQFLWMPLGSRILLAGNAELRIPVNQNIGVVLFQDVGALWHEKQACFYVGGATGFGLRYLTPIGPLRFDIGFKNKPSQDDRWPLAWFLTLGHAF